MEDLFCWILHGLSFEQEPITDGGTLSEARRGAAAGIVWANTEAKAPGVLARALCQLPVQTSGQTATLARNAVGRVLGDRPASVRQAAAGYLMQIPAWVRRALRSTAGCGEIQEPVRLSLRRPEDLIPFLPVKVPSPRPATGPTAGASPAQVASGPSAPADAGPRSAGTVPGRAKTPDRQDPALATSHAASRGGRSLVPDAGPAGANRSGPAPARSRAARWVARGIAAFVLVVVIAGAWALTRPGGRPRPDARAVTAPVATADAASEFDTPAPTRTPSAVTHPAGVDLEAYFKLINQGIELSSQGRHQEAVARLTDAARLKPNLSSAYAFRSMVHRQAFDTRAAVQDADEALRLDGDDFVAWLTKGWVALEPGRGPNLQTLPADPAAAPYFTQAIRCSPTAFEAYHGRGKAHAVWAETLEQAGPGAGALAFRDAARDFTEAMRLVSEQFQDGTRQSTFEELLILRAKAYHRMREYGDAVRDCTTLIVRNPGHDYGQAFVERGTAYMALKKFDEAVSDFTKRLEYLQPQGGAGPTGNEDLLRPFRAYAYTQRGMTLALAGQLDKGVADLNRAIHETPTNALAYLERGRMYQALGDPARAQQDFLEANRLDPTIRP